MGTATIKGSDSPFRQGGGVQIPVGDYLIEVLDYRYAVMPNGVRQCATLTQAMEEAPRLTRLLGGMRWRVMRCVGDSTQPERYDSG